MSVSVYDMILDVLVKVRIAGIVLPGTDQRIRTGDRRLVDSSTVRYT